MLNLVQPKYFLPIHGEYRQLAKHAQLASHLRFAGLKDAFVLETGQTLEIDPAGARPGERITVGRVCIDSGSLDDVVEDMTIRDRRHLAEDGFVLPDHRHQQTHRQKRGAPGNSQPRVYWLRGRRNPAGSAFGGVANPRNLHIRRTWRLGRDAGKDTGRAEALHLTKQTQRRPLIMPVILEL